jgi:hypothetical protein
MKKLTGAVIACLVMSLLAMPVTLLGEQLPAPAEKSIYPGITTIQYAGQTFVFTSSTSLRVNFHMVTLTTFEITVRTTASRGTGGPQGSSPATDQLVINWKNFNADIYDDEPPSAPWTGLVDTEGGWTEK